MHELHSSQTVSGQKLTYLAPDSYLNLWRAISQFKLFEAKTISYASSGGTAEHRSRLRLRMNSRHDPCPLTHPPGHTHQSLNTCNSFANQAHCFCKRQYSLPGIALPHFFGLRRCLLLPLQLFEWHLLSSSCHPLRQTINKTFLGSQRQSPLPPKAPPPRSCPQHWSHSIFFSFKNTFI